jgi:hypothetical protein
VTDVAAGQRWHGPNHGSVWMVFDGDNGLFDLWCEDPGTSTTWRPGSIAVGFTAERIRQWLDPRPGVRVDTSALRSWTSTTPGQGGR